MPSSVTAKTALARRRATLVVLCLLAVVMGARFSSTKMTTTWLGRRQYQLEIAASPADQVQGLSGRVSMPANHGMLFLNLYAGKQCFWMKDMRFPLDMIWLSGTQRVVQVRSDIPPATFPQTFCAPGLAQYVIELNAGEASQAGIKLGQTIQF